MNYYVKKLVKESADIFRSAPFWITMSCIGLETLYKISTDERLSPEVSETLVGTGLTMFFSLGSAQQIRRRYVLEDKIRRLGYSDRLLKKTPSTWCSRQNAIVATGNTGCLEDYLRLCEKTKSSNQLTWIPHI